MSQVHHTPKGELSRAPRIVSVEEFMPCSWNLPSFPFLHPFSISLNFLYPPGHAGCELEETKAMLKYPRLQKEVLKNPQGFWLTALSCKLFRDWKTDKGPSSEMLQDLQNPSERSRNFNPQHWWGQAGSGGISAPSSAVWDARDTSKTQREGLWGDLWQLLWVQEGCFISVEFLLNLCLEAIFPPGSTALVLIHLSRGKTLLLLFYSASAPPFPEPPPTPFLCFIWV